MALLSMHSFRRVLSNIYGSPRGNLALIESLPGEEQVEFDFTLLVLSREIERFCWGLKALFRNLLLRCNAEFRVGCLYVSWSCLQC